VAVERWGPQWLDLFGVDRFRQRVVFIKLAAGKKQELLEQVQRLETLQHLALTVDRVTPSVCNTLSELPHLRKLRLEVRNLDARRELIPDNCVAAIARMTGLEHLELGGMTLHAEDLACLERLSNLKSLTVRACKPRDLSASLLSRLPALPRLEALDLSYSELQSPDLRRLAILPRLKSLGLMGVQLGNEALTELTRLDFLEDVEVGNIWEERERSPLATKLKPLLALDHLKLVRIRDVVPALQLPSGVPDDMRLKLADGRNLPVWDGDVEGVRRNLNALQKSKPGIVVDVRLDFPPIDWRSEESAWSSYDRSPIHDPTWLPASDVPWMTAAERADFHEKGGWARFDAAGWGNERADSTSF
jgi:hypothetical protein